MIKRSWWGAKRADAPIVEAVPSKKDGRMGRRTVLERLALGGAGAMLGLPLFESIVARDARAAAVEADRARVRAEATSDTLREVLESLRDERRNGDSGAKSLPES